MGELVEALREGRCPDCGGTNFYLGPRGGLARNIRCAGCGHHFNVAIPWFAERIACDRTCALVAVRQ